MVEHGPTRIMSVTELDLEREETVLKTLEKVSGTRGLTPLRLLDIDGVCKLLSVSRSTVDSYRRRKKNPLEMKGHPPRIEDWKAWEWYQKHSGEYQED